jgi:hypothetical protein
MNFDPVAFPIFESMGLWALIFFSCLTLVLCVSFLTTLVSVGSRGPELFFSECGSMLGDLASLSPRRIYAIAQLTFREAVRRKALMVFVVFAILFMFAGWFLTGSTLPPEFQVKVYVTFVLRAISWLILPVVLLLSCWGIPEDIRVRSLHTVVTKPARRLEIVLGRMFGFSFVGLVVLAVMSMVGWGWIRRQLPEDAKPFLTCRQPIWGNLTFKDREGNDAATGINTGDFWMYHSYIEGSTKARAIWTFYGVKPQALDAEGNLPMENRFQAFRSHKGDMRRTTYFQYTLINPDTGLRVPTPLKTVEEGRGRTDRLPRKLVMLGDNPAAAGKTYDLFDDLVSKDGRLVVEVSCVDPGQYLGMAKPDLFIRTPDQPFESGYFKAVACVAMMVLLIIFIGVSVSTFVKGPVATLLTLSVVMVSQTARDFMGKIVGDPLALEKAKLYSGSTDMRQLEGGGVLESIYRIINHMNPTTPMPENLGTKIMMGLDAGVVNFLWLIYKILPNFDYFSESQQYLANGFDVRWDCSLSACIAVTLAYFFPCVLLGYFALRVRELEAK